MDCIFCKIINGLIPAYKVYENDHNIAFLDIHPHAQGHTVVIPKKHAERIFDLDEESLQSLMIMVKKTMQRLQEKLHPDGFNVGWNDGQIAGQVVPHLHIHIFPRYKNDKGGSIHSIINNSGSKNVEEIAKLFKICV